MTDDADHRVLPTLTAGSVPIHDTVSAFDEQLSRETVWASHSHPTHELLWNESGVSTVGVGNRVWTVTPVLGLWIPAGLPHSASASAGTWYRTNHFDIARVPHLSDGVAVVKITPLLRLLLLRLTDAALTSSSRGLTEQMVLDVLEPAPREHSVTIPAAALLEPVVAALREDPGDERSLTDWARIIGTSPRTLTRAFVAETGLSYSRWVAALRAQDAIYLLGGGMPAVDVAEMLGYASQSAFGAAMKRVTGSTPSAFAPVHSATE